jgi:hypothetical protein
MRAVTSTPVDVRLYRAELLLHDNVERTRGEPLGESRGNRARSPMFVDPDEGDYRLQRGSPPRNSGRQVASEAQGALDLDGRSRRMGRAVDIGAYEVVDAFADGFEE